jgi:hypothetical protein
VHCGNVVLLLMGVAFCSVLVAFHFFALCVWWS